MSDDTRDEDGFCPHGSIGAVGCSACDYTTTRASIVAALNEPRVACFLWTAEALTDATEDQAAADDYRSIALAESVGRVADAVLAAIGYEDRGSS